MCPPREIRGKKKHTLITQTDRQKTRFDIFDIFEALMDVPTWGPWG
jgi:hypothetical protein